MLLLLKHSFSLNIKFAPKKEAIIRYLPHLTVLKHQYIVWLVLLCFPTGWVYGERLHDQERGWFPSSVAEEIMNKDIRTQNLKECLRVHKSDDGSQNKDRRKMGSRTRQWPLAMKWGASMHWGLGWELERCVCDAMQIFYINICILSTNLCCWCSYKNWHGISSAFWAQHKPTGKKNPTHKYIYTGRLYKGLYIA